MKFYKSYNLPVSFMTFSSSVKNVNGDDTSVVLTVLNRAFCLATVLQSCLQRIQGDINYNNLLRNRFFFLQLMFTPGAASFLMAFMAIMIFGFGSNGQQTTKEEIHNVEPHTHTTDTLSKVHGTRAEPITTLSDDVST